jgi:hypothetical protein
LNTSKGIENIVDLELLEEGNNQKFFIIFHNPETNQVKKCNYEAKNSEEACYILAKINFLRFSLFFFQSKECFFFKASKEKESG